MSRTIRLIGFGLDDLSDRRIGRAPDLFATAASEDELLLKRERLSETVDKLRRRGYTL